MAVHSYDTSLVGRIPAGESFAVFGKIGYAFYDWKVNGKVGSVTVASSTGSDHDFSYGAGVSFTFGKKFVLSAEYKGLNVQDGDYSTWLIGGAFKF